MIDPHLDVWAFDGDMDGAEATVVALDRLRPADFRAALVSDWSDVITLQVVEGDWPTRALAGAFFYVERRGRFVLVRREIWPGRDAGPPRLLLTMRAHPSR
jgi:hypothetical protein